MKVLSRAALAEIDVAHASPSPRPIEILQIGEGVFMRGFVDWMVDVANEKGVFRGGVAVAAPRRHPHPPPLAAQDCLYTVLLRGRVGGVDVAERRVVTAVQAALDPYAQWDALLQLAGSRELRFVVSNTTEAGIADVPERYDRNLCPTSFPAKAAAILKARYDALGGGEAPGLVFLPCELIEANGATLRCIVLEHARRWEFDPAFADWVAEKNRFLDTLVDRIVSGYPATEAEALRVQPKTKTIQSGTAPNGGIMVVGPDHPTRADEPTLHVSTVGVQLGDASPPQKGDVPQHGALQQQKVQSRAPHTLSAAARESRLHAMPVPDEADAPERKRSVGGNGDPQLQKRLDGVGHQSFAAGLVNGRFCWIHDEHAEAFRARRDSRGQARGSAANDEDVRAVLR